MPDILINPSSLPRQDKRLTDALTIMSQRTHSIRGQICHNHPWSKESKTMSSSINLFTFSLLLFPKLFKIWLKHGEKKNLREKQVFKSSNRNPLQFNCIWTFYTHKCKPKNSEREVKTRDTLRICGLQFPTNNQVQIIISSLCTFGQILHTWLKSDAKRWSRLTSEHKCSKHF